MASTGHIFKHVQNLWPKRIRPQSQALKSTLKLTHALLTFNQNPKFQTTCQVHRVDPAIPQVTVPMAACLKSFKRGLGLIISGFEPGFLGFRVDSLRLTVVTIRGLRALSRVHLNHSSAIWCYCDVQVALNPKP